MAIDNLISVFFTTVGGSFTTVGKFFATGFNRFATYLALSIVFCGNIIAQNLEGIVLDAETHKPVHNAIVYLDGTSFVIPTNTQGRFNLDTKGMIINTRLVISHVSYQREIISNPFDGLPEVIYLEKQITHLDEVIISTSRGYTRNQMLKAFRKQFLGRRSCKIQNEDDIMLRYDTETNILYASSNVPIYIENKHLGYKLFMEITEYKIQYKKSLFEKYPIITYAGTVLFEDLAPNNHRIARNRREAYEDSPRQFFRLIATENLRDRDYALYKYKDYKQYPADELFTVENNPLGKTMKTVIIKRNTDTVIIKRDTADTVIIKRDIADTVIIRDTADKENLIINIGKIVFRPGKTIRFKPTSQMIFYNDTLSIDIYGYEVKPRGSVFITGDMGLYRTGDMLPLNYGTKEIPKLSPEEINNFIK